jgi:type I restriction enzyme R subunit
MPLNESDIETIALEWLGDLGWKTAYGPDIAPEGTASERACYGTVILEKRLKAAIERLNPTLTADQLDEVLHKITQTEKPAPLDENHRLHEYLLNGVEIEIKRPDGTITGTQIKLIDFECPANNDWLAVNQFTVIESQQKRRPDVVLFVNGLPLGVIELKNVAGENTTLDGAFRQLQVYKQQIPSLFRTNALLVISDGLMARLGSVTSDFERFMPWRTVDGITIAPKGTPELHTLIHGIFEHGRFLDLVRYFTAFQIKDGSIHSKLIAGYHQFHAVRHAMRCTINAACEGGNQKIGVIWHTQGSGKSLLMAFYAGRVIADPAMANPTLVVITDRNDLDDQIFGT